MNNEEIKGIKLHYYSNCYMLSLNLQDNYYKAFVSFNMSYQEENKKYFKNLELDKYYTLKELGL